MLSDHDTLGEPETLDGKGMMLLRGNEVSAGGPHLLHVGASRKIEPCENRQQVIDAIRADGGVAILCHPNWQEHFNHYPYEQLLGLNDYTGIEILNGVVIRCPGEALATDKWDRLLATGKKVWGYGNDDAHAADEHALAWTVVRAKERSEEAVLEALRSGSCYVSSGVAIEQIRCTGRVLRVFAPTAQAMAVFGEYARTGAVSARQRGLPGHDAAEARVHSRSVLWAGRADGLDTAVLPARRQGGPPSRVGDGNTDPSEPFACGKEPRLTGRLDDPAWSDTPGSSRFLDMKTGDPATVETAVKCLLSDEHVVFGIRCEEPLADQLKMNISRNGDPNIWTDDSIEIFLAPEATGERYLQVMVSAAGYAHSVWMPDGDAGPDLRSWRRRTTRRAGQPRSRCR